MCYLPFTCCKSVNDAFQQMFYFNCKFKPKNAENIREIMKPRKPKSKPTTINSTTKDMQLMTKEDTISHQRKFRNKM